MEVARVNELATEGLMPDLTILLWIEPDAARARAGDDDRFEEEGVELQRAVARAYEQLASAEPERWRRVDAARPPEQVHAEVLKLVESIRAPV